ncbi:MAG: hypothetical protein ACOZQL_37260, partial [Myxococcota bacterium]
ALPGAVGADAVGLLGSLIVDSASGETFDVRVQPSGAADGAPNVIGPLQTNTHGVWTQLGSDRAFLIEATGTAAADVRFELAGVLVPEAAGGDGVQLLDQPVRWLATNPNDTGFRAPWTALEDVLHYPVLGAEQGATGMLGALHLGPAVWRSERVSVHLGPHEPTATTNTLTRWSTVPVDGHFPWRYSSFFVTPAGAGQEVELRASSDTGAFDTGPEPWVDAVGFFSPQAPLAFRPLSRPLVAPARGHVNDEDVLVSTGLSGIEGVTGTITFDLPVWPWDERNRWTFVHVAQDTTRFPGALGGGLEGPDWMTAGLNQNGRVTVRFVSRVTSGGQFAVRHYTYVAGGSSVDPSYHVVTVNLRVDGVFTTR